VSCAGAGSPTCPSCGRSGRPWGGWSRNGGRGSPWTAPSPWWCWARGSCATRSLLAEDRRRVLDEMAAGARFLQRSPATVAAPFLGLRVLLLAVEGDTDAAEAEAARVRGSGATRHRIVGSLIGYAEAALAGG
jgi:hypothetical protein